AEHRELLGGDLQQKQSALLKKYEKELADVLTPEKYKRFRQMVLQVMEGKGGLGRLLRLGSPEEVESGLKLTASQKASLIEGAAPEKVLSAEQQKAWQQMKGPPFTGTLTQGPPRFP